MLGDDTVMFELEGEREKERVKAERDEVPSTETKPWQEVTADVADLSSLSSLTLSPSFPPTRAFVFANGTLVVWSAEADAMSTVLSTVRPFGRLPVPQAWTESEQMAVRWDLESGSSGAADAEADDGVETNASTPTTDDPALDAVMDTAAAARASPAARVVGETLVFDAHASDAAILAGQLAFSHALARSAKVSYFEERVDRMSEQLKEVPDELIRPSGYASKRNSTALHMREIMAVRSTIHLHANLLEIPDVCWEDPQLERYYEALAGHLDLDSRVAHLNRRLDFSHDLVDLLRTELQHEYSIRLEKLIIILIAIEVGIAIVPMFGIGLPGH